MLQRHSKLCTPSMPIFQPTFFSKHVSLLVAIYLPADRNHLCEMLFAYEDENRCCFNDLDKQFYDRVVNATLSQGENLDELMMQFLRINSNVLVIDENAHIG